MSSRCSGCCVGQHLDRAGPRTAGVLLGIPVLGADGGQEVLHGRVVPVEQAAVEVARIPVDEHAAQVEDDGGGGRQRGGLGGDGRLCRRDGARRRVGRAG